MRCVTVNVAVPMCYDGTRYFNNDLQGALAYLWKELHDRAGGVERRSKPQVKVMWTANLKGYTHYYDSWLVMEADFEEGETNGK